MQNYLDEYLHDNILQTILTAAPLNTLMIFPGNKPYETIPALVRGKKRKQDPSQQQATGRPSKGRKINLEDDKVKGS